MTYIPKSKLNIKTTNGKEFRSVQTKKAYVGKYMQLSNGKLLIGSDPLNPGGELEPLSPPSNNLGFSADVRLHQILKPEISLKLSKVKDIPFAPLISGLTRDLRQKQFERNRKFFREKVLTSKNRGGYVDTLDSSCRYCSSNSFTKKGFGTEQVVESLQEIFPDYNIVRMDHDTTRRKNAYEEIILDFQQQKIDILVGTQMIAKGFDFEKVSLVGIIDADSMLNYPDFRSHERAFQLLSQVSGRAGRKEKQGAVILQTYNPEHEIINFVKQHSYSKFYSLQISERKSFKYPPFSRLIFVKFRHTDHKVLDSVTEKFSSFLRKSFKDRVLGPEYPLVSKVKNYYLKSIMLKIEADKSFLEAKSIISFLLNHMKSNKMLAGCVVQLDVDPN